MGSSQQVLGAFGQFIIPSMKFKCDGNITHFVFFARGQNNAQLQFQAWKPLPPDGMPTAFSLATSVDVSWNFASSGRTTINEALASPLPVSASHVLGIFVNDTNDFTLFVSTVNEGGFTMYSAAEMSQTLAISNLTTTTTISMHLSVTFGKSNGSFL